MQPEYSLNAALILTPSELRVSPVTILRPGKITAADISRVLNQPVRGGGGNEARGGEARRREDTAATGGAPKAPGMK